VLLSSELTPLFNDFALGSGNVNQVREHRVSRKKRHDATHRCDTSNRAKKPQDMKPSPGICRRDCISDDPDLL